MMAARIWTLGVGLGLLGSTLAVAGTSDDVPRVTVGEQGNVYVVSAQFTVAEPAVVVRTVLTDYEQIPRFMPGVRTSRVLEREPGRVRIEQEAVSRFMMFSRRLHLVLDITEAADVIQFRDVRGTSFTSYEGSWTMTSDGDRTAIEYRLTATPAFQVPGFVLRRLLDRDARAMIEGLRSEIATRALPR